MADTPLGSLPAITTIALTDELYVNDAGAGKKITYENLLDVTPLTSKTTAESTDSIIVDDAGTPKQMTLAVLAALGDFLASNNAVINPGCAVAQVSTAPSISTTPQVGQVDMMGAYTSASPSAGTIAQAATTLVGTSGYALHVSGLTVTSGNVNGSHRIESLNSQRFVNQAATFTVKVYHDKGSNVDYTLIVNKADASNDWSTVTNIHTGSATAVTTATATSLTVTVPDMGDCSNGIELIVQAACGSVTTKNFYFTEWQLDLGSVSLPYRQNPYINDLDSCLRYYENITVVQFNIFSSGIGASTTTARFNIYYKEKISAPVITSSGALTLWDGSTETSVTSLTTIATDKKVCHLQGTVASGLTQGNPYFLRTNDASGASIVLDSRLY